MKPRIPFYVVATAALISCSSVMTSSHAKSFDSDDLQQLKSEFIDMRFGMFICYNIMSYGAEWSEADYPVDGFNPQSLDCEQWADAAVSANMKFGLLTTKHHEGFCLWDSEFTEYDVASTPYQKDVVQQYVDAFRSRGLRVGLYYSIRDMTEDVVRAGMNEDRMELVIGQITELLTNYGEIDYFVMDGWFWAMGHNEVPYHKIRNLIRELQPNCLITDHTHMQAPYHMEIPYFEGPFGAFPPETNTMASALGHCSLKGNGWFWNEETPDGMKETDGLDVILEKLNACEARYCNFMLNCMPNRDGLLDPIYIKLLKEIGENWTQDNSRPPLPDQGPQIVKSVPIQSIYGTSGTPENLLMGRKIGGKNYYSWQSDDRSKLPQTLLMDLGTVVKDLDVLLLVPNHRCKPYPEAALKEGNITNCRLSVSKDGMDFKNVGEWTFPEDSNYRNIQFPQSDARYLKLEVLEAVSNKVIVNALEVGKSKI